jgi:hypothetical protein
MSYIGNQPTSVAFLTDQFSGTGSQTAFTLSAAPANTASILVAVSGVLQDPTTYSTSGLTLTFSSAPPSGTANISVRYLGIPASNIATTAYRTVTDFTATAGQTTFTPPSYTAGFINVYRNGARLGAADYTATNGTTVVLATGATSGDLVTTESFYVSSVLNAIPATNGAVTTPYILDAAVTQAKLATGVAGTGPAFSASPSSSQTISNNTLTKILLQTEQYDTNNNFASSTFTPTVAGYYNVTGQARLDYTATRQISASIQIYKNGSLYLGAENSFVAGTGTSFTANINTTISMNGSTDTIELYLYFYDYSAGANYPTVASQVRLQGFLARAA